MRFITAKIPLKMKFFGHEYELAPITYPEVDLRHVLAAPAPLAETLQRMHPDHLQIVYFEAEKLPGFPARLDVPPRELPDGSRLMIVRDAGIGDIIMLTPALKALKNELGNRVRLSLATLEDRHPLLDGLGLVDRFHPLPIPLFDLMQEADRCFLFTDPKRIYYKTHLIDFYSDSLSLDFAAMDPGDKLPFLNPALCRSEAMLTFMRGHGKGGKLKVFHAPGASDPWRRLPPRVLDLVAEAHPDVLFFVPRDDSEGCTGRDNVHRIDTSGGLADFVTAISLCDLVISADSAAFHVASALGKPSLVLFGPIHPRHARYYPLAVALGGSYSGETCRVPCGVSGHAGRFAVEPVGANRVTRLEQGTAIVTFSGQAFAFDEYKGCPEANVRGTRFSPCISSLPEESVLEGFEQAMRISRDLERTRSCAS